MNLLPPSNLTLSNVSQIKQEPNECNVAWTAIEILFFNIQLQFALYSLCSHCTKLMKYRKFLYTGCPKIKLALGKHLEVAIHGFKLCILYGKREKLGSNPSRPFLGHPWRHAISIKPIRTPQVLPGARSSYNHQIS